MKTVSIIIPVYNVAQYLPQCLDSLTAQTYPALEIILIDDGSTDSSGSICDRYAGQDSRFRVIHQANAGAANAKNAGLDGATGDFIAFIDSDDYVESNWIARLVETAEAYHADVVECDFDRVYRSHSEVANQYTQICVFTAGEYLGQYLGNWTCSLFWNKLFRRGLLADVRFRKERRCIDDEFFTYKAVTAAKKVVRITDVLYHYRQRASGVINSAKNYLQITDDALEVLIERYCWVSKRFPELRKKYLTHDVETMLYFAKDFLFQKETIRKFRKTARFYLKETIVHWAGIMFLFYALRLQTIKPCQDADHVAKARSGNSADTFP